jgi:hypothetical protein
MQLREEREEEELEGIFEEDDEYRRAEEYFMRGLPKSSTQEEVQARHKQWRVAYMKRWREEQQER